MNPMVEITLASSAFVRTNANFALQNACWGASPNPALRANLARSCQKQKRGGAQTTKARTPQVISPPAQTAP